MRIEVLENRNVLSSVGLFEDVLVVEGDARDNYVEVRNDNGTVVLNLDGQLSSYDGVSAVVVNGRGGNDYLVNRTSLVNTFNGGLGNDYLQGGMGNDNLFGGKGDDVINDFSAGGGSNVLDGGNGSDNLWGGGGASDFLVGGNGWDTIYDIVGGRNTVDGGNGVDRLINRVTDLVLADDYDVVVSFGPRTGPVVLDKGILYLNGTSSNDSFVVNQLMDEITVLYTQNGNTQTFTFKSQDVKHIAGLGGDGDDTFTNNSNINSVFYGTGGNDSLSGGTGSDILKGGNGNDFLYGGAGGLDDLTGDAGSDFIIGLTNDIVRTDIFDKVFSTKSFVVNI